MDTLRAHPLDDAGHEILLGRLPDDLIPNEAAFEALWDLHPEGFHEIMIHGRLVKTPRWQQAYGRDYQYTGQVNRALPVAPEMEAMFAWFKEALDPRLNGLLFNWYDGARDHYIGAHRDSTVGMIEGAPIVTLSLGEERVFRMRPWKGRGYEDVVVGDGDLLVIPFETNQAFTHEVPKFKRYAGRRISVTARAFTSG
jgi:alkylated DNA repair dioxygenase AlkB